MLRAIFAKVHRNHRSVDTKIVVGVEAGTHAAAHHQVDGILGMNTSNAVYGRTINMSCVSDAVVHVRKAFHGWTRICRPGTVQTVKQEATPTFAQWVFPSPRSSRFGKTRDGWPLVAFRILWLFMVFPKVQERQGASS